MATVAEKSADLGTLVDDIASTLTALADWSDADASVTNSGSSDDPQDNGRVLSHAGTGVFLHFFVEAGGVRDANGGQQSGIRFIYSTDWDTVNHRPSGFTNVVRSGDPYDHAAIPFRNASFAVYQDGRNPVGGVSGNDDHTDDLAESTQENAGHGAWAFSANMGNRSAVRNEPVTYFLSGRNDGLQVGVWNTTNSSYGMAGWFSFEYVDAKFFNDGVVPVVAISQNSSRNSTTQVSTCASYGFQSYGVDHTAPIGVVGCRRGPIEPGRWGTLNPDAADDTFFYRKAVVHGRNAIAREFNRQERFYPMQMWPIANVEDVIPNQPGEGVAHGDIVADGGVNYRGMVQSGASKSNAIGVALRYE